MTKCTLAIDPGGTTGMAIRFPDEKWHTFTCSTPEQVFDFIKGSKSVLQQIVIENFQAQTISKWGLHTVRIVGGVYALAHVFEIGHKVHIPQDRYPFQKDSQTLLRRRRSEDGIKFVIHEEDALAHLLRFEFDEEEAAKRGK